MQKNMNPLQTGKGSPSPFGATPTPEGINFTLHAPYAQKLSLHLFDERRNKIQTFPLDPIQNKTGTLWHLLVKTDAPAVLYGWEIVNHKYIPLLNETFPHLLLDPFASETSSAIAWNQAPYAPLSRFRRSPFDWGSDQFPLIPPQDLIIYEMHVRAFTQHPSSKVGHPGTFLGVKEKIPYLKSLGVNALELMPIFEFNEQENHRKVPETGEQLFNFWGYSTVSFGSPNNRYGVNDAAEELKELVKAAHAEGIEIYLDVAFNHTAEMGQSGPCYAFKALDPTIYYQTNALMEWLDFTGCGNTVNTNHPVVREWILSMLRHWVQEYHIDGFRFDLASIFYRGEEGTVLKEPSIVETIAKDPLLHNTKLIAEAWDAAGLYQVGNFYHTKRWAEWNGAWRDTVRRFIKGNRDEKGNFATKISGSQDLFFNRSPVASINFVTCHDGFTLRDLVSYNEKHNLNNGEGNRDGNDYNESWNCGAEGGTSDPAIQRMRIKQMKNFLVTLFISQGVPMLLSGDEYGHTKLGNNNTWCHDTGLNWFLWDHLEKNGEIWNFTQGMIELKKRYPHFRKTHFLTDEDIVWRGTTSDKPQWNLENHFVAFVLKDQTDPLAFFIAFNASNKKIAVTVPKTQQTWMWVANTAEEPPIDYFPPGIGPLLIAHTYTVQPYSAVILKEFPSALDEEPLGGQKPV